MQMAPPGEFDDPVMVVLSLLVNRWDSARTPLAGDPEIHTGQFSADGKHPAVAVGFSTDEGPIGGGDTGYTATHQPSGKGMQRLGGFVMIDVVAGTRAECADVGPNGSSVNPKTVRWGLYDHATQILTDAERPGDFRSVAPRGMNRLVDTEAGDALYHLQFRAVYIRDRLPTAGGG